MRFIAFIKKWTLPVAMATGVALYLIFSQIEQLDDAARFFNGFFSQIVPVMLFFVLFFTFCNVDFKQMRLTRWHLWILIIQVVLVAVAVAVVKIFNFGGSQLVLAQNLLTCIIAPGATAAPVVTAKLGGNVATMTAYTYLSNFLAALLIPLVFPLVGDCIDMGFLPAFLAILGRVCEVLLLPMLAAWVVKRYLPKLHSRIAAVPDLSFYTWAVMLAIIMGMTAKSVVNASASPLLLVAIIVLSMVLCAVQFVIGKAVGRHYRTPIETGQSLGQKNTAFAIWISTTYLSPIAAVGTGCYILWQNAFNSLELWQHQRKS